MMIHTSRILTITFLILTGLTITVNSTIAGTYWVNPEGSAESPYDTKETGMTTLTEGLSYIASHGVAGDTLMVSDGVYTENVHVTSHGDPTAYIYIMAETSGGVTIDGSNRYDRNTMAIEGDYNKIVGFRIRRGGSYALLITEPADHNYIKNCFISSEVPGNGGYGLSEVVHNSGSYGLMEDCWVVGGARYLINDGGAGNGNGGSNYNIYRRCVGRWDWTYGHQPVGGFMNYHEVAKGGGTDAVYQNCIVLDFNMPTGHNGYLVGGYGDKYGVNVERNSSIAMKVAGCNDRGQCFTAIFDQSDSDDANIGTNQNTNMVVIDSGPGYRFVRGGRSVVDRLSIFNSTAGIGYMNAANSITNSLFYSNASATTSAVTYNYCHFYNETAHGDNSTSGDSGILYPVRIENASVLNGSGQDGKDRGATILKRLGVDGTHYGDAGWNVLTSVDLWPFPNEDKIKKDFSSVADIPTGVFPATNNPARGFAADGNGLYGGPITLTSYIWEALGEPCPEDMCRPKNPIPSAPENLRID